MKTFTFKYNPSASLEGMFDRFEKAIKTGEKHIKSDELTSDSIENIFAAMSKGKLELFYAIAQKKPESLYHLAQIVGRDPSNVFREVKSLEGLHLVKLEAISGEGREKLKPVALYDRIIFDFGAASEQPDEKKSE